MSNHKFYNSICKVVLFLVIGSYTISLFTGIGEMTKPVLVTVDRVTLLWLMFVTPIGFAYFVGKNDGEWESDE